ncbi:helix-turn-helix transcriptional regulator, partial [Roseateles sp.]|uniref:helix-turn-helix transcriptional regulator n=1 Tax=Roseateles sp. TaxID=1971397 RepID=UPI00391BB061
SQARGLIAALHDRLLPALDSPPSLEQLAAELGMSPATLKRRLALHGTHYQAELDQLRALMALYLLQLRGQPNEAVAQALGFFDGANFRRFFKRWTGLLPSAVMR